jgi:hypothetical protein
VHVVLRREPSADIDYLPDTRLSYQVADHAFQEVTISPGGFNDAGNEFQELICRVPVDLVIVFTAEKIIVDPGDIRDRYARFPPCQFSTSFSVCPIITSSVVTMWQLSVQQLPA